MAHSEIMGQIAAWDIIGQMSKNTMLDPDPHHYAWPSAIPLVTNEPPYDALLDSAARAKANELAHAAYQRGVEDGSIVSAEEMATNPGLRIAMGIDEVCDVWPEPLTAQRVHDMITHGLWSSGDPYDANYEEAKAAFAERLAAQMLLRGNAYVGVSRTTCDDVELVDEPNLVDVIRGVASRMGTLTAKDVVVNDKEQAATLKHRDDHSLDNIRAMNRRRQVRGR